MTSKIENQDGLSTHRTAMAAIKGKLARITQLIQQRPVLYLDYPVYNNVGDLLINLGTETFFNDFNINVTYRYSNIDFGHYDRQAKQYRPRPSIGKILDRIDTGDLILFQGGGNFGDLYPQHEEFRKTVLRLRPNAPAILLPQSLHISSGQDPVDFLRPYRDNEHFTILVRDNYSEDIVSNIMGSDRTILLPDMAHQLWETDILRTAPEATGPLIQARNDEESIFNEPERGSNFDWQSLNPRMTWSVVKLLKVYSHMDAPLRGIIETNKIWYAYRNHLVNRAISTFGRGNQLTTDRLHGLILGCLLDKRVYFYDNNYMKLGRYYDSWLGQTLAQRA